jgi:ADP-heptose:LPS heptosyltransferase
MKQKRILVIHSWGMGDMIMATPMLKSLAKQGYRVDVVTFSESNCTILKGNHFIERVFLLHKPWQCLRFWRQYDYLVATAGMNPQKVKQLNYLIGAKKVFASKQIKGIHRIDMNLKIIDSLVEVYDKEPYIAIEPTQKIEKYLSSTQKNIGLAVGSGAKQAFKRWDKYGALIEKLEGNKLLFIGPDEEELEALFHNKDVTIVKEGLLDTIALISKLDLLVGNDNGLMHIGYSVKVPCVGIFGMTNEKETGGYGLHYETVSLPLSCRPCFESASDRLGCSDFQCLYQITTEMVYQKCQQFL